ncbi:hypothetical protein OS493_021533 [Desmophyllum pertusum]|uniref:Uncharacterized protein n=1 Tax=Desmophyllum pertusum TaxID=174260 RepID=A0A9W9YMI3_9CNID|nr:hypothetical protein OS493_021533 [Desmophyllum pertusum]
MKLFNLVIWNCLVFFTSFLCFVYSNVSNIDELLISKEALEIRTKNSTAKWPLCVLYRDPTTPSPKLEQSLVKFLRSLPENNVYKDWTIVAFNLDKGMLLWDGHPGSVPLLQCHIGTASSPLSYPSLNKADKTTRSLHQWFKNVNKLFAKRLPPLTMNHLPDVIVGHGGYTLVGIPGHLHHQTVENTLKKVAKSWKERIKVFVVIPFTDEETFMMQTYNVSQLPAVIVFNSQEWREKEKPLFVLQSVHEVEERRLETMLVTLHSQANQLNLDNFLDEVLSLYDLECSTLLINPEVISRYVNASDVYAVPFTVVFWQEREFTTQRYIIKQQVFDKDIPTLYFCLGFYKCCLLVCTQLKMMMKLRHTIHGKKVKMLRMSATL